MKHWVILFLGCLSWLCAQEQQEIKKHATIGIAGVSIPGAVDCIQKINLLCPGYFQQQGNPTILMHQPNFSIFQQAFRLEKWDIVSSELLASIDCLKKMGADFVIIPANTVHRVIAEVQEHSSIPVLNMLQVVSEECRRQRLTKVGVLGTSWTMAGHLYRDVLKNHNVDELIPTDDEQKIIQDAIFLELIPTGRATPETLSALLQIVKSLKNRGCDGIILACTELPLVLNEKNCEMAVVDTTAVLAEAALKQASAILSAKNPQKSDES